MTSPQPTGKQKYAILGGAVLWLLLWADWSAFRLLPPLVHWILFPLATLALWAFAWTKRVALGPLGRVLLGTSLFVVTWHLATFTALELGHAPLALWIVRLGLAGLFLAGLALVVWWVERTTTQASAVASPALVGPGSEPEGSRIWNPLHLGAWFYRGRARKLDQSILTLVLYSLGFVVLFLLLTSLPTCSRLYELPAGGGKKAKPKVVIQQVLKKKIVINPFSSILFNPPPIEDVKLEFQKITEHAYEIGQGEGDGAGFAGGTKRGKMPFVRLEYSGGDWDQDYASGADLNMLLEYGIRTKHQVEKKPESITLSTLGSRPLGKAPPFVYMTGQKGIAMGGKDIENLRKYLIEEHGMLFADNGGSHGWHGHFFSMMQKVLPKVKPIRVPLDHTVHLHPNPIPFLPYVAPHGGKDAWGWVVNGRLVCYYHPGDIGDAWADDHAGVKRNIWNSCYDLGVNVMYYAAAEKSKFLTTLKKEEAAKSK